MTEFAKYYIEFLKTLFKNIYQFFYSIIYAIYKFLILDLINYFKLIGELNNNFRFFDWVMLILASIINIALAAGIVYFLYLLLRRYIKFASKEIEKDQLLAEIANLTGKNLDLEEEKNKILNLKMETLGIQGNPYSDKNKAKKDETSRFVKLMSVDRKYDKADNAVVMSSSDMMDLKTLVERFVHFSANKLKLYYPKKVISAFFAGMATSKVMILEGISGTGKTSLPYAMGKFFQNDAAIIPVQPSWRDRAEMIGYLNEFTKRFNETDFLRALYETTYRKDLNFIILDELNLARVEYYFAEFLSIMEMPNEDEWKIDVLPDSQPGDPKHIIKGKLLVPQNIWFVGTANRDDSTFTITDKVYDRATSIEMNAKAAYIDAPDTEPVTMSYDYLEDLFKNALNDHPLSPKAENDLSKLGDFIVDKFKIAFGNRIMKQIRIFVPVFVACGQDETAGLDYMVARKIIRKFEVLNLPFLQDELNELVVFIEKLFGKNGFPETIALINDLRKQV